ncbi:hypothetical protein D3C72_1888660 [compost metagenome]
MDAGAQRLTAVVHLEKQPALHADRTAENPRAPGETAGGVGGGGGAGVVAAAYVGQRTERAGKNHQCGFAELRWRSGALLFAIQLAVCAGTVCLYPV